MITAELTNITKSFGPVRAVDGVSFAVHRGEIFGLLGPNGAGKTTTIRIMLDILRPDAGQVSVLGGAMTEAKKERIGYMPEDRGLYQDIPLERCLVYLATLKGVPLDDARRGLESYLERFDLADHRHKKVKELSRGMQQKAQIIATLLHEPELVVIDEPFSGLDPVNTQMVMDLLDDLHERGVTIIMSTHQMHQVEELCQRILLVNAGKVVLYGELAEIRRRFAGHAVRVRADGELPKLAGMERIESHNGAAHITLSPGISPQDVLRDLVAAGVRLEQFEIAVPTLDDIFIQSVKGEEGGRG